MPGAAFRHERDSASAFPIPPSPCGSGSLSRAFASRIRYLIAKVALAGPPRTAAYSCLFVGSLEGCRCCDQGFRKTKPQKSQKTEKSRRPFGARKPYEAASRFPVLARALTAVTTGGMKDTTMMPRATRLKLCCTAGIRPKYQPAARKRLTQAKQPMRL